MAQLHTHFLDGLGLVVAEGVLDVAYAPRLSALLDQVLDVASGHAVVDLSTVSLIDTATAGVLAAHRTRARERGGELRADGVHGLVLELLEVLGLAKPLGAYRERPHAPLRPDLPCCARTAAARPVPPATRASAGRLPDQTIYALLIEAGQLAPDDTRRAELRARAIETALPAARRLAGRYRDSRDSREDLEQVAAVGLIKAIDGFDPARGHLFSTYAVPTILGELRRHFRDRGWSIRVPRPLQELYLAVKQVVPELSQQLYRAPTVAEVADALRVDEHAVIEALAAADHYRSASLSTPVGDDAGELGDLIGATDPGFDQIENRQAVQAAIARMPTRMQRILAMRFGKDMTQTQIAAEFGLSQMQISRLLTQANGVLRQALLDADHPEPG